MKHLFLFLAGAALAVSSFGQPQITVMPSMFDSTISFTNMAPLGNSFLMTGYRTQGFNNRAFVARFDSEGNFQGSALYDSTIAWITEARQLESPFGPFVAVGTAEFLGSGQGIVTKFSPEVELLWGRSYDASEGAWRIEKFDLDDAGNIYAAGHWTSTQSPPKHALMKLVPDGSVVWSHKSAIPAPVSHLIHDVAYRNDTIFVIGSINETDITFGTFSAITGEMYMFRTFGDSDETEIYRASSFVNGYILLAFNKGNSDAAMVVKISPATLMPIGAVMDITVPSNGHLRVYDIMPWGDDAFIAGRWEHDSGHSSFAAMLDYDLYPIWACAIGEPDLDFGRHIVAITEWGPGVPAFADNRDGHSAIIRLNNAGELTGPVGCEVVYPFSLAGAPHGPIAGYSTELFIEPVSLTSADLVFADHYFDVSACFPTGNQEIEKEAVVQIYPNPVLSGMEVTIPDGIRSVTLYNMAGQTVPVTVSGNRLLADVSPGVYQVMMMATDGQIQKGRLLVN